MGAEQAASPLTQFPLIPYLLIFAIIYFLIIKPQRDKQNQQKDTMENLKKNDHVVTAGGIHATVTMVKEKTVIVRIDDTTKIEIDKEAVSAVIKNDK